MARHTASTPNRSRAPHAAATADERAEVQEFLDRYASALTSGDIPTLVSLWETPAFVLSDAGEHDVRAIDEVENFFRGAKQQYNALGITDTRAEIESLHWLTERIVAVQVHWPYLDAQGREQGEETSTYTLRRDDDGKLRLRVTVMHGAAGQKEVGRPKH